jgi:hypothetical protein
MLLHLCILFSVSFFLFQQIHKIVLLNFLIHPFVRIKKILTVFICYLAISMKEFNVIPVLITFGNTYGLVMVSILLGYGLVALPRSLWRQANPDMELRRTYIMAVAADEALYEAVWALQVSSGVISSKILVHVCL